MSVTSKKSSAKKAVDQAIDRPFDPAILMRAKEMAPKYRLVIAKEDDGYSAHVLELPNVFGWGSTLARCEKETRELLVTMLAFMWERGEEPPTPAEENKRNEQVNVRLTAMEKMRLEEASRRQGFRGLSDYIRNKALEGV
jgi:predicted RNase H-like HicB family nuclease